MRIALLSDIHANRPALDSVLRDLRNPRKDRRVDEIWFAGIPQIDRKSTRLNSSHLGISYAVFCLQKKTNRDPSIHTSKIINATYFAVIDLSSATFESTGNIDAVFATANAIINDAGSTALTAINTE